MSWSKHFRRSCLLMLFVALLGSCSKREPEPDAQGWRYYRGDPGSNAYSNLDFINRDNVKNLEVAWIYQTGDTSSGSSIQCNPLIIDGVLYGISAGAKAFALNAATGEQLWSFDPSQRTSGDFYGGTHRGLVYWEGDGEKRLFYCVGPELLALDANTGKPDTAFGTEGAVDLKRDLDLLASRKAAYITNTSPGVIYNDLLIIGSSVHEAYGSLPGHIRAYHVKTGELKWKFHTIPHPGEFGHDTWPENYYQYGGGVNAWGGMSIDYQRGIVFIPLGSATHDFYGADRHGPGLFSNCILALDAETGSYRWHYQVSRHDLWDYDLPTAPNLTSILVDGQPLDVVVQLTKQGLVFILDRDTGKPVFEIEERPVPASSVEGEAAWPTQPFPTRPPPLVRQHFTPDMITSITPESRESVKEQLTGYEFGPIYTPPSLSGIVQLPGFRGGAEWSGGAVDPETGYLYIGLNDIPNMVKLIEGKPDLLIGENESIADFGRRVYDINCASCHGPDLEGSVQFPALSSIEKKLSIDDALKLISTGRGMMPSFGTIPESDRRSVLSFLYGMNEREAREFLSQQHEASEPGQTAFFPQKYKLEAYQQLRDHLGYPGIEPPWGILGAVDLNQGDILWKVPLGEYEELSQLGIPATGTQLFGGGIVTAGGVIFIGASRDEKFRAVDKSNGQILWEYQLPAGGYATPATYVVNKEQYVVIAAGGGGMQGTRSGDYYFAFKLPETSQ